MQLIWTKLVNDYACSYKVLYAFMLVIVNEKLLKWKLPCRVTVSVSPRHHAGRVFMTFIIAGLLLSIGKFVQINSSIYPCPKRDSNLAVFEDCQATTLTTQPPRPVVPLNFIKINFKLNFKSCCILTIIHYVLLLQECTISCVVLNTFCFWNKKATLLEETTLNQKWWTSLCRKLKAVPSHGFLEEVGRGG